MSLSVKDRTSARGTSETLKSAILLHENLNCWGVRMPDPAGLGLNQSTDRLFNPGQRATTGLPISGLDNAETIGTAFPSVGSASE